MLKAGLKEKWHIWKYTLYGHHLGKQSISYRPPFPLWIISRRRKLFSWFHWSHVLQFNDLYLFAECIYFEIAWSCRCAPGRTGTGAHLQQETYRKTCLADYLKFCACADALSIRPSRDERLFARRQDRPACSYLSQPIPPAGCGWWLGLHFSSISPLIPPDSPLAWTGDTSVYLFNFLWYSSHPQPSSSSSHLPSHPLPLLARRLLHPDIFPSLC